MELEVDVKITSSELYDYLLYHTYTGFSGIFGTLAGVFLIMLFVSSRYVIYLIAGAALIIYLPGSLFLKAKQQMLNNPVFKKPLHYKMTDDGISVSQGENEETQSWESCVKAVSTGKSIILYTSKRTASIFPKKELGDKKEALIRMISTHMPPKKVKIRS
ncbi:MAG: YcxB family protein [Lachnospiraceae bacterium]|nr:YcxB family protein [Lachnospiraceae bacterium]